MKTNRFLQGAEIAGRLLEAALFPAVCPVCGGKLPFQGVQEGQLVHPACEKKLQMIAEPYCRRCGKQLMNAQEEYCADCRQTAHVFDSGRGAVYYNDAASSAIFAYKYGKRQEYAVYFADLMIRRLGGWIQSRQADAVTGVPVSPQRLRLRGFNQSQLLAEQIGERMRIPVLDGALHRHRQTQAQKGLGRRERERNLEHVISAVPAKLTGIRTILLIDDIYTTGSTADACASALKRAGVRHVHIAVFSIGGGY